ncbi:MAG: hypothetical protein ACKVZJ_11440 [Phycisphaerales bacterium]
MVFLRALLGGMIGALIGAAVWFAVAYFLSWNVGIIAWGIGALAGFGAFKLSSEPGTSATGAAAVLAAILGVLGGKYATAHVAVNSFASQLATLTPASYTDDDLVVILAEEELDAVEAMGKSDALKWPKGMDRGNASAPDDYPPNIAGKAKQRFAQMKPEEREAMKQRVIAEINAALSSGTSGISFDVFLSLFSIFDILWITLAAVTAWKIGAQDDTQ